MVETTNLRSSFLIASDALRLTERFTRVGPDTLHYEVTVEDPQTWTRPWTLMIPLRRSEQHIYEYACHEGNFGLAGILSGARAEEHAPPDTDPVGFHATVAVFILWLRL